MNAKPVGNLRSAMIAAAAEYGALGLGCFLGLGGPSRLESWVERLLRDDTIGGIGPVALFGLLWSGITRLLEIEGLGGIALLCFLAEAIRFNGSSRLRREHPAGRWLGPALFLYAGWFYNGLFVLNGPSLVYRDNVAFVVNIHLLLPFLLAIGPLVRARAWIGVAGAVLFFATALSIVVSNGVSWYVGCGFFHREVA